MRESQCVVEQGLTEFDAHYVLDMRYVLGTFDGVDEEPEPRHHPEVSCGLVDCRRDRREI